MVKVLRVCVGQVEPADDVAASLDQLQDLAERYSAESCDVLVLPELFIGGGYLLKDVGRRAVRRDGPEIQRACELAKRTKVSLVFGYPERSNEAQVGRFFNAAIAIEGNFNFQKNKIKVAFFFFQNFQNDFQFLKLKAARAGFSTTTGKRTSLGGTRRRRSTPAAFSETFLH